MFELVVSVIQLFARLGVGLLVRWTAGFVGGLVKKLVVWLVVDLFGRLWADFGGVGLPVDFGGGLVVDFGGVLGVEFVGGLVGEFFLADFFTTLVCEAV